MTTVLDVHWVAKEGEADRVAGLLPDLVAASSAEPGCLAFSAHRGVDDPARFFLHEEYEDDAALEAHLASPHFRDLVRAKINPLLESQDAGRYEPVAG